MKRYLHPLDNLNVTLFQAICDFNNLKKAHKNAKRNKGWYFEVQEVDKDLDNKLLELQKLLLNKEYHTSEYKVFTKKEGKKEREIYKLPYYPDRIVHWAIMQVIEPILLRQFISTTYSAIPKRGIHKCLYQILEDRKDLKGTQYCLKLDVKKYYPSINHDILKSKYRRIFKDDNLLWLLGEIIDSVSNKEGIPIGNYLSQYSGNFYLSSFDHWIKEECNVKYYYRYMDDIVILHNDKQFLHNLFYKIKTYLFDELRLTIKDNWQIFPIYKRGLDYVGYRIYSSYVLLRKSTKVSFINKMIHTKNKLINNKNYLLSYTDTCSVCSYLGWLKHCNSYSLQKKYIVPLFEINNYKLNNS